MQQQRMLRHAQKHAPNVVYLKCESCVPVLLWELLDELKLQNIIRVTHSKISYNQNNLSSLNHLIKNVIWTDFLEK